MSDAGPPKLAAGYKRERNPREAVSLLTASHLPVFLVRPSSPSPSPTMKTTSLASMLALSAGLLLSLVPVAAVPAGPSHCLPFPSHTLARPPLPAVDRRDATLLLFALTALAHFPAPVLARSPTLALAVRQEPPPPTPAEPEAPGAAVESEAFSLEASASSLLEGAVTDFSEAVAR